LTLILGYIGKRSGQDPTHLIEQVVEPGITALLSCRVSLEVFLGNWHLVDITSPKVGTFLHRGDAVTQLACAGLAGVTGQ